MTQELLASYVSTKGSLDKGMVDFGLGVVRPLASTKTTDPNDRFDPKTPAGLEIYIVGEWAAFDFPKAAAYAEKIPQKLLRLSAWIEIPMAYTRRLTSVSSAR